MFLTTHRLYCMPLPLKEYQIDVFYVYYKLTMHAQINIQI